MNFSHCKRKYCLISNKKKWIIRTGLALSVQWIENLCLEGLIEPWIIRRLESLSSLSCFFYFLTLTFLVVLRVWNKLCSAWRRIDSILWLVAKIGLRCVQKWLCFWLLYFSLLKLVLLLLYWSTSLLRQVIEFTLLVKTH